MMRSIKRTRHCLREDGKEFDLGRPNFLSLKFLYNLTVSFIIVCNNFEVLLYDCFTLKLK